MEGRRGSAAGRGSHTAQGPSWEHGTGQSGAREFTINPSQCHQCKGEMEAGLGGSAPGSGEGVADQCFGHETAGCLDEAGVSDGVKCHLERRLEVEDPEDQIPDSGV